MRRTNINAVLRMLREYLNGDMNEIDFYLDFPYEIEKRYLLLLTAFVGQSPALFDVWTSLFAGGAGEGCRSAEFNWQ